MSGFQRKGTVSKSSGPTHINSYALKDMPIKYTPPVFVPDLIRLPSSWAIPSFPSEDIFRYDYGLEQCVLNQAKARSLSVVAEASQRERELEARRHLEMHSQDSSEAPPMPCPPPSFSLDSILTPVPVLTSPPAGGPPSGEDGSDAATPGDEGSSAPPIRSLGQMSIREFEGDTMDPFELASLQAINDMAELQSVLQSTVCLPAPPPNSSAPLLLTLASGPQGLAPPHGHSPAPPLSTGTAAAVPISVSAPALPPSSASSHQIVTPETIDGAVIDPFQLPQSASAPSSSAHTPFDLVPGLSSESGTVATDNISAASLYPSFVTTPSNATPIQPLVTHTSSQQPPAPGPSVGTLIDIGSEPHVRTMPHTQKRPVPTPRKPPAVSNGPSSLPHPSPPQHVAPPSVPPKPQPPHPRAVQAGGEGGGGREGGAALANHSPTPPRGGPATNLEMGVSPSIQARTDALVANLPPIQSRPGLGVSVLPPVQNRPGLGVPVLPPLNPASRSPPIPALRSHTPPPPYFAEQEAHHATPPQPVPRRYAPSYSLPNPLPSMAGEEREEVESMAGMGFPSPRVARAHQRYSGDRSKVLDFLFLVGQVEDMDYNGDSAETALLANEEDLEKTVEYLKRVNSFKEFGFPEKAIHEAYQSSGKDWDKALDILTQDR